MWWIGSERWWMGTWPTARSLSTVLARTPRRNSNRRVQGMGILKPIHVGVLKPQIQIQTHPYSVMECSFKQKNSVMKNPKKKKKKLTMKEKKKFRDEIEEKRWSKGWAVLMADGYGEESGLGREEEEEKKKKKKMV